MARQPHPLQQTMNRPRVAVIGTGIAGMSAAYHLKDNSEIVFYEKEKRPGGHTHTVCVQENGRDVFVDTGFMVYNEITYPRLTAFFKMLDIPVTNTSMSFSVQHLPTGLEYCGTGIGGLFAQKRNLLNISFWQLLSEIDAFNKQSPQIIDDPRYKDHTLASYVAEKRWHPDLLDKYLLPMSGAIWSTTAEQMMDFPAATLVHFFKNHGLLGLTTHFQWKTVRGGSRVYRDKVLSFFPEAIRLGHAVQSVEIRSGGVFVRDSSGEENRFDQVVIATHADEALSILASPKPMEQELLSGFRYQNNRLWMHTDSRVMPKRRSAWSSWNYRSETDGGSGVIYWMNSLQQVSKERDYFISMNSLKDVETKKVLWEGDYTHPVYDLGAIEAQKKLSQLNQTGPIFFCGSYFGYGFHEDAFCSGVAAAQALLEKWTLS